MVEVSITNYEKFKTIADNIDSKFYKIREDSRYSSSHRVIYDHQQFHQLREMGTKILPYVFHKAVMHGFEWTHLILFRALINPCLIPDKHAGKFLHQVSDWMVWYLDSEYYKNNKDVYFGLVE